MKLRNILILMILIILVKIYISLRFPTPFVFLDEYLYSSYAKDIIYNPFYIIKAGESQIYPPGYPILIIPSFVFYPNIEMVYRSVLAINCIFSTSILLISYLILKRFVPEDLAFFGSVLVTLLPASTLYSFMILSENLYIPLYLLSGYLILRSFDSNNKFLHIFTGFIIFYLTITRAFGILAYVSFLVVIFYKIFTEKNYISFLRNNSYLIFTSTVLLYAWSFLKRVYNLNIYGYDSGAYIQNVIYIFENIRNFVQFMKLVIHEFDYLMLASYFVFFIFSILILYHWKKFDKSTKIYVLYSFVYAIFSIILTAVYMIEIIKNPDDPQYTYYFIWGRYIDPVLPTIFIVGLISWDRFIRCKCEDIVIVGTAKKYIFIIVPILTFIITYPYYSDYKVVNVMSIYYVKEIIEISQYFVYMLPIMFLILSAVFFRKPKVLVVILIIFSLITSISSYEWLKTRSNEVESINNIGRLLSSTRDESILIDQKSFGDSYSMSYYLVKFWAMPNNLIYEYNMTNLSSDIEYIVSKQPLHYDILKISPDNVILYNTNVTNEVQMIPGDGFHIFNYDFNNMSNVWMENNGSIYIYNPNKISGNTYGTLQVNMKSFHEKRNLQVYANKNLVYEKQIDYTEFTGNKINLTLKYGDNIITFYTPEGCKKPIDVIKSTDIRCLSIYFQNISLI